jgi:preprotein translocase subunit SecY
MELTKSYVTQFEGAGDALFMNIVTVQLKLLALSAIVVGVIFVKQILKHPINTPDD